MSSLRYAALCLSLLMINPSVAGAVEPPYESRLLQLAEILGSLHFLRNLCGEETDRWRAQMDGLLVAENPDAERRARLVASFNRGYRSFAATYTKCTPSAIESVRRYTAEGEALARDTAARFAD